MGFLLASFALFFCDFLLPLDVGSVLLCCCVCGVVGRGFLVGLFGWGLEIIFMPRGTNSLADCLAKAGSSKNEDRLVWAVS